MIFATALPKIKASLKPARLAAATHSLLVRLIAAFLRHPGRMSASCAAGSVRSLARHRAQLTRFLARDHWSKDWLLLRAVAELLLRHEAGAAGTWVFVLDQTYCGQQGAKTENTFSRANYRPRPKRSGRQQQKYARRSCHGFVMGLLLTPSGLRIPGCRCYYTKDYCRSRGLAYRTQIELAAQLVRDLAVPPGAPVVVLGDTAFEAADIRAACAARGFTWVMPLNPERVLAGPKPRPKVLSSVAGLPADRFAAVRLVPGTGPFAAQRRAARCRVGPKAKARTYYVHSERRAVHNVGDVLLVFSTRTEPRAGEPVEVQKVLLSGDVSLSAARVVELYELRWQVELFFKELKSTLGFARYRLRRFAAVEGWAQACLVTFCYLEWYRAGQLARGELSEQQKGWWRWQRSYGLALAVLQRAEEHDLGQVLRWSETGAGLRKLRRALRASLPLEYRQTG